MLVDILWVGITSSITDRYTADEYSTHQYYQHIYYWSVLPVYILLVSKPSIYATSLKYK